MISATACVGTMTNARSAGAARSASRRTAGRPNTVLCAGCTGISSPENPAAAAAANTNRDQPDVSDAPTSAMRRGAKNSASRAGEVRGAGVRGAGPRSGLTKGPIGGVIAPPPGTLVGAHGRAGKRSAGHTRFLRQAEHPLADDAALDLACTRINRARAAGQEDVLPGCRRVTGPVGADQRVGAYDAHRQLAQSLVVLAPDQLGDRRLRPWRPAFGCGCQRPQSVELHDLDTGVGTGQFLPDQRVSVPAVLLRRVDQLPELALIAEVLHRNLAATLVAERGHRDLPAVVQAADHMEKRDPDPVEIVLAEFRRSGHLADRAVRHPRVPERQQYVGQPLVLGCLRVGSAERE